MKTTRTWAVYGLSGHRQRESFSKSYTCDFSSEKEGANILEIFNSDLTGTNEYSIIRITRNTAKECERELRGQLSDGVFENSNTGLVKELTAEEVEKIINREVEENEK